MKLRAFVATSIATIVGCLSTGAEAFDCTGAFALPHSGGLIYVRACVKHTRVGTGCRLEFQGYVTETGDSMSKRIPVERIDLFYEIGSEIRNGQSCYGTEICSRTEGTTIGGCPRICAAAATIHQNVRIGTSRKCLE